MNCLVSGSIVGEGGSKRKALNPTKNRGDHQITGCAKASRRGRQPAASFLPARGRGFFTFSNPGICEVGCGAKVTSMAATSLCCRGCSFCLYSD